MHQHLPISSKDQRLLRPSCHKRTHHGAFEAPPFSSDQITSDKGSTFPLANASLCIPYFTSKLAIVTCNTGKLSRMTTNPSWRQGSNSQNLRGLWRYFAGARLLSNFHPFFLSIFLRYIHVFWKGQLHGIFLKLQPTREKPKSLLEPWSKTITFLAASESMHQFSYTYLLTSARIKFEFFLCFIFCRDSIPKKVSRFNHSAGKNVSTHCDTLDSSLN